MTFLTNNPTKYRQSSFRYVLSIPHNRSHRKGLGLDLKVGPLKQEKVAPVKEGTSGVN